MTKRSSRAGGPSTDEPLPESIAPRLATLARRPPAAGDRLYKIKYK